MQTSIQYMSLALQLAERGRLTVSPNPKVGCVIVKNNQMVGQGYHQRAGEAHAEIHALKEAGEEAKDATVYVTLEPCCHHGKTPPCIDALIQAGIKKVYIAILDPNPLVAGKGAEALRAAGIEVEVGIMEKEAAQLNEVFFHYITTKQPFVIAKWAMSLDGKTVTHPEDNRKISGDVSHRDAHVLRQQVDAILIGAETARKDNPLLTVRLNESTEKQPIRVILSASGNIPDDLKMFDAPGKTILIAPKKNENVETIILSSSSENKINLHEVLNELGKRQITSLLVEGGTNLLEQFFQAGLVNKVKVYIAPVIVGGMKKKKMLEQVELSESGSDWRVECNW